MSSKFTPRGYRFVAPRVYATTTRPADTTAYASGDLVANSTTAASVVAMQFNVPGQFEIARARILKSSTSTTNASFRLHLYHTDPSTTASGIANGDNGAWSTKECGWLGALDVTVGTAFTDGAVGFGTANTGVITSAPYDKSLIYGLLEARGVYTPASAEVFTIDLELLAC